MMMMMMMCAANTHMCIPSTEILCTTVLSYRACQSSGVQEVTIEHNREFSRDVKVRCVHIDVFFYNFLYSTSHYCFPLSRLL